MIRIPEALKPLLVPIDTLNQHPDNPRNGDIEVIAESIRVNGYMAPVVVQATTRRILAGNHRYAAMLSLGQTQIPAVFVDVTDEQAARYLVADNRTSDLARNDEALLAQILLDLSQSEIGLLGSGWDEHDMHALLLEVDKDPLPEGEGFGFAPNDVYQVVIECDSVEQMEEVYASCVDREWNARKVLL